MILSQLKRIFSGSASPDRPLKVSEPVQIPPEGQSLVELPGIHYIDCLAGIVKARNAQRYLEIGTNFGDSLAPIDCASIAVDPGFKLKREVVGRKPQCLIYQMTSDDYFARYDPTVALGGALDAAFLDGMHLYEFLLRDFIHTERHCAADGVIVLHDCVPPTLEMTNREFKPAMLNPRYLNYWTGDVWKMIPILKEFRPDLKMEFYDCPPSGLVVISNLNPSSSILAEQYDKIVAEWRTLPTDLDRLRACLATVNLTESQGRFETGAAAEPRPVGEAERGVVR